MLPLSGCKGRCRAGPRLTSSCSHHDAAAAGVCFGRGRGKERVQATQEGQLLTMFGGSGGQALAGLCGWPHLGMCAVKGMAGARRGLAYHRGSH